jgi:hypothetical protein
LKIGDEKVASDVIEFADWKVRKEAKRYFSEPNKCDHKQLTMDPHGFTVQCDDCKLQLSAYWVLERMLDQYRKARDRLASDRESHRAKMAGDIRMLAARGVEKAWRSRNMVPTCPHCSRGIFPADGFGGSAVSKELELARRERDGVRTGYGARSASTIRATEEAIEKAGNDVEE